MFLRRKRVAGHEYMDVVEAVRRDGKPVQRYVGSLGRYDERVFREARRLVRDLVPMEAARVIVAELEEVSGPVQGKHYFRKFRRS